jgi:hypothetical protein
MDHTAMTLMDVLQEDVTACVEALKEQYGPDFLEHAPEDGSQGGWGPAHPVAAAAATLSSSLSTCECADFSRLGCWFGTCAVWKDRGCWKSVFHLIHSSSMIVTSCWWQNG